MLMCIAPEGDLASVAAPEVPRLHRQLPKATELREALSAHEVARIVRAALADTVAQATNTARRRLREGLAAHSALTPLLRGWARAREADAPGRRRFRNCWWRLAAALGHLELVKMSKRLEAETLRARGAQAHPLGDFQQEAEAALPIAWHAFYAKRIWWQAPGSLISNTCVRPTGFPSNWDGAAAPDIGPPASLSRCEHSRSAWSASR